MTSNRSSSPLVHVEGEVERITFENRETGFRVVKIAPEGKRDRLTVVGTFPELAVGARIRVSGTYVEDRRHGTQLRAESVTELAQNTLVGISRYLGSGLIKGIGEKYAERIVASFGMDTLRILDEEPQRLAEVEGLGRRRAETIASAWQEQKALRDVMVFLQSHGASPQLAQRIFKRYGAAAKHVVASDPYRLALEVHGVGFKTADRIAAELGVAKDSPTRVQAGILQVLHDAAEAGHVCVPEGVLFERAATLLGLDALAYASTFVHATLALVLGRHVVRDMFSGVPQVYAFHLHAAEVRLAGRLRDLCMARVPPLRDLDTKLTAFEHRTDVTLAPEQRDAVLALETAAVLVVTGGPGVGKTTVVRALISMLEEAKLVVRLAAPTGRAAKRMTEATHRPASTLHRLLEFEPKSGRFLRHADHPIEGHAVIVDESSMIDLPMADALAQAIAPGTRLVFVGDVDQLPSVGPGAVLNDVLRSGLVTTVRLTRIYRQARESLVVTNAHRIHDGLMPIVGAPDDERADFFMVERRDPEAAQKTIVELVAQRIPRRFGMDPVRDIQVLTPMHRGPAGSAALNDSLQNALNPSGPALARGERVIRLGDKVMQHRNNYEKNVWNGDIGVVSDLDAEEETLTVSFDDGRQVRYELRELDEISLAYASTIHKSQGSEYPAVVLSLMTSHFVMLSKNLLYTAVTRAKRLVVLVCDKRALEMALANDVQGRGEERWTWLAARLTEGPTLREGPHKA